MNWFIDCFYIPCPILLSETPTAVVYQYKYSVEKIIKRKDLYENEVLALKKLSHSYIVKLNQVYRASIVMDYYPRGDMYHYIQKGMPEYVVKHYGKQLIEALIYCHTMGISHRDVKPDNLLLTDDWNLKLCDFGLSSTKHTESIYCGTPDYACPEMFEKIPYNPMLADTWSFGVTLYAMLMASLPWGCWTGSKEAKQFLELCLQKDRPYLYSISDIWLKNADVVSYMSSL